MSLPALILLNWAEYVVSVNNPEIQGRDSQGITKKSRLGSFWVCVIDWQNNDNFRTSYKRLSKKQSKVIEFKVSPGKSGEGGILIQLEGEGEASHKGNARWLHSGQKGWREGGFIHGWVQWGGDIQTRLVKVRPSGFLVIIRLCTQKDLPLLMKLHC